MTTLQASEVGQVAATAIAEIIERATASAPVAEYADGAPLAWSLIEEGGWDFIGVPESADGGGANLRDLVEVAQAWGRGCVPLPLLETTWAKRWSSAARDHGGPVSVSVAHARGGEMVGMAAFGALAGVALARSVGGETDVLDKSAEGEVEPFAPALRPLIVPWVSDIPAEARRELGVIWAAEAVGAAQRLVDLSVQYAKDRQQFGKPIGSFQAVKHRLADMHSDTQYAESAVIWASLEPGDADRASRYALDTAIAVAQGSIQVHGGMGFTWEMGLHFFLRNMLMRRQLVQGLWS